MEIFPSSFIDLKSELDIAKDDYRLRYGEAKSVLDFIADCQKIVTSIADTSTHVLQHRQSVLPQMCHN
jgi:hypothetical protein